MKRDARVRSEAAWRYRLKAEECRTMAETMHHPGARQAIEDLADHYDLLADRILRRGDDIYEEKIG